MRAQIKRLMGWVMMELPSIYKIFSLLVASMVIWLMFHGEPVATRYNYSVGSIWNGDDLYAPFDFAVVSRASERQSREERARAATILFYTPVNDAASQAEEALHRLSVPREEKLRLQEVLHEVYRKGYMEPPHDFSLGERQTFVLMEGNVGGERAISDYYTPASLYGVVQQCFSSDSAALVAERMLKDSVLKPSVAYDPLRTELELASRMAQTESSSQYVEAGELVVAKGERITPEKADLIHSLEQEQATRWGEHYNPMGRNVGLLVLCLIAFGALFFFMKNTQHEVLEDTRKFNFLLVVILLMAGITAMLVRMEPSWVLLAPLCIAPILVRIFLDMHVALYSHLTLIIILGNLVPNSFEFTFYQLIAGIVSLIAVRNFEKRSKFFVVALVLFLTYSAIYTAGTLSQDTNLSNLQLQRYVMFFLNATLTLLAYPLIYIFEKLFGLTTDLTLMEMTSINTPVLRELSQTAPGTFQHALQVANISESIITEIGGNALLARVGGLYHDIGKMANPLYFTENQNNNFNPHDNLGYEESAQVIIAHVHDGVDLAHRHHLPECVIDFIRTHHGTTYTGYFHARWRQEHPDGGDDSAFYYPGPRPYTREMAVVMIVDSVEAACRSLKSHDKEDVEQLVDRIIEGKVRENQFSNCNITFAELSAIRSQLKEKMKSIYHVRVSYPVVAKPVEETT